MGDNGHQEHDADDVVVVRRDDTAMVKGDKEKREACNGLMIRECFEDGLEAKDQFTIVYIPTEQIKEQDLENHSEEYIGRYLSVRSCR